MCFIKVPKDIEEVLRKPDANWTDAGHARVQEWINETPEPNQPYHDLREPLYRKPGLEWTLSEQRRVINWLNRPPQLGMMVRFSALLLFPQGNHQDAEDVTQDFFVRSRYASVVQNFDPARGCFCAPLRRALRNFCLERKRNTDWLLREPLRDSKGDILRPRALAKKLAEAADDGVEKTVSSFIRWKWAKLVANPKKRHKKLPDLIKVLEEIQSSECAPSEDYLAACRT